MRGGYLQTAAWSAIMMSSASVSNLYMLNNTLIFIYRHLYNLAAIPSELRSSLLCLEVPSNTDEGGSSVESLQCGWSLARRGIQLTLAGGAVPIFTLEQVGNRVSLVTAVSLSDKKICLVSSQLIDHMQVCLFV